MSPNTRRGTQRFSTISAGRTSSDACFHPVNQGQYANSTAAHPGQPLAGNLVTMGGFRPNDDGYLWCATRRLQRGPAD
ncbi:hypothetical protein ACIRYZ_14470 [Kitasatospora sp. NPDC101155]|uniref:hypothetical protein n=1 Tax=Kitasatospora sp. NPDC101155 TaxID=3364097 RepID=UPI00381F4E7E